MRNSIKSFLEVISPSCVRKQSCQVAFWNPHCTSESGWCSLRCSVINVVNGRAFQEACWVLTGEIWSIRRWTVFGCWFGLGLVLVLGLGLGLHLKDITACFSHSISLTWVPLELSFHPVMDCLLLWFIIMIYYYDLNITVNQFHSVFHIWLFL